MTAAVREQLDSLLIYARGVGRIARQDPERGDLLDGGRGYIGGALTTLFNLNLLTHEEHSDWSDRLMAELPPTNWIGG